MFVGAGDYQKKGIEKAKEMGLLVIATDGNPDAPGLKIADFAYAVDVKNFEKNLEIARKNTIDGILTIASEVSVRTVAYICQELKLPGITVEVADRCTDKELMRKVFREANIPVPVSYPVFNLQELIQKAEEIGFPIVIKPADSAGSRGVKRVENINELEDAFFSAMSYSGKKKILVEAFMEGKESSVEAFVCNDKINILSLSDKVRTDPPYLLDTTVIFPSAYPLEIQQNIIEIAKKAINAAGIKIGAVHLEIMMTSSGPIPVEIAARGAGFKVYTDILPNVTGIDILKATIQCALGEPVDLSETKAMASVLKFIEAKPGKIKKIINLDKAKEVPGIYEIEIYKKPGEIIRPLQSGDDRIGHIISFSNSRSGAINNIKNVENILEIIVEE